MTLPLPGSRFRLPLPRRRPSARGGPGRPQQPLAVLAALLGSQMAADRKHHLAFPGAIDLGYADLAAMLSAQLFNNVGDPWEPGHGRNHTKPFEVQVVRWLGALFSADPRRVWGYVTSGATEGTIHAISEAATAYPDVVIYASTAAHYSVAKAADLVRAPLVLIRADGQGRMLLAELRERLIEFRDRPAMVVATVGTTELEGVDDVAGIAGLRDELGITRWRLHVDAAMAGIPRALLPTHERAPFGFDAGASSLVVSGHKFLGTLHPCAVVMYPNRPGRGNTVPYIGAADTTISGSRSGHTPLLLYWSLTSQGLDGHRRRADDARELAAYTHERLRILGWRSRWQYPAFTITLAQPHRRMAHPWVLGGDRTAGRIITMPGLQRAWIDEFLDDLAISHRLRTRTQRRLRPSPAAAASLPWPDPAGLDGAPSVPQRRARPDFGRTA